MTLRAIDLYSGVGGWSLGLRLAGVDVVASYEWWKPAALTCQKNLSHNPTVADIRSLELRELPSEIDIVVGSPPCTQFSFSNRGGSGDLSDGLKDIAAFLRVVDHLKPRWWAMENVPRVANVLEREFKVGGQLERYYRSLGPIDIDVLDISEFGLPQKRKRCIAGIYSRDTLLTYRALCPSRTLGQILRDLNGSPIKDSIYGIELTQQQVTDHEHEPFLNDEETRMNREAKSYHPVYNNMPFPDPEDRPVRTVTATCTRVSRESIVIETPEKTGKYRRLTVRERALLQGFPITFQFFSERYAEKLKMVGNAIPPLLTYYIGCAMSGIHGRQLRHPHEIELPQLATDRSPSTKPDDEGRTYPRDRRFRAAIPHLRFKSGMRFELTNNFSADSVEWRVDFYYGSSKDIRQIPLDSDLQDELSQMPLARAVIQNMLPCLQPLETLLASSSPRQLQRVWSHSGQGLSPYSLVDGLGAAANSGVSFIQGELDEADVKDLEGYLLLLMENDPAQSGLPTGSKKVLKYASEVLVGLQLGSWFNSLPWHMHHNECVSFTDQPSSSAESLSRTRAA